MRGFFLGGLSLALGCLAAHAQAQEIQWRPVTPRPALVGTSATQGPAAVAAGTGPAVVLGRPTVNTGEPPLDAGVRPVGFSETAPLALLPLVRAQAQVIEVPRPLPAGSSQGGTPEPLPLPKSSEPDLGATTNSSDCWGGAVTPLVPGAPVPEGVVMPGVPGDGVLTPDCGDCCGLGGGSCGGCCDAFGPCCGCCCGLPGRRFWASAEYLLWDLKSATLPPLVTGTTLTPAQLIALGTADPTFRPGALGQVGTSTLYGGGPVNYNPFSGGRFTIGTPGPWGYLGLEATFFFLGQQGQNFSASSGGEPGLYRPFYNVTTPPNDAEFVAFPGLLKGSVSTSYATSLWGAEANGRLPVWCTDTCKFDLLGGFRYLDLTEHLNIHESVTFLVPTPPTIGAGDNISLFDNFGTLNHFYGGQVGGDFEWRYNRFFMGSTAKLAMGSMHQVVNIGGQTVFTPAGGGSVTAPGGLLTQASNMGHFHRNQFTVVPEIGFKIGYQVTEHMDAFMGYTFLYVSSVVRPADQVDLRVNTTQIPAINSRLGGLGALAGPATPVPLFKATDFWAQGVNFGLRWRY